MQCTRIFPASLRANTGRGLFVNKTHFLVNRCLTYFDRAVFTPDEELVAPGGHHRLRVHFHFTLNFQRHFQQISGDVANTRAL